MKLIFLLLNTTLVLTAKKSADERLLQKTEIINGTNTAEYKMI